MSKVVRAVPAEDVVYPEETILAPVLDGLGAAAAYRTSYDEPHTKEFSAAWLEE
jgi:hypothetical protein